MSPCLDMMPSLQRTSLLVQVALSSVPTQKTKLRRQIVWKPYVRLRTANKNSKLLPLQSK